MTTNEIIVIAGGLFFGFVMMNAVLALKNKDDSYKNKQDESSNSSDKNTENEESAYGNSNESSSAKEEYIQTSWYKILEVSESAPMSEISIQYKRKIILYHPDRVASLGKELGDLAELKSKEINLAYEFAKRIKG